MSYAAGEMSWGDGPCRFGDRALGAGGCPSIYRFGRLHCEAGLMNAEFAGLYHPASPTTVGGGIIWALSRGR